jgi:hypothetical protein
LHFNRTLLEKYPRCKQLLDCDSVASGAFLPLLDDPDHTNAFATTAWEIAAHNNSYHPVLAAYATAMARDQPLTLRMLRTEPVKLYAAYDSSGGGFNPPIAVPAAVLAAKKAAAKETSARAKKNALYRQAAPRKAARRRYAGRMPSHILSTLRAASDDAAVGGSGGGGGGGNVSFRPLFDAHRSHARALRLARLRSVVAAASRRAKTKGGSK